MAKQLPSGDELDLAAVHYAIVRQPPILSSRKPVAMHLRITGAYSRVHNCPMER